jgi:hypothetical protein
MIKVKFPRLWRKKIVANELKIKFDILRGRRERGSEDD